MKDIVKDIERLQDWACNKANKSCENCAYAVNVGRNFATQWYFCGIGIAMEAAGNRAKEGEEND